MAVGTYDPGTAARRGADLLRERRLRARSWHIGQCAVASAVAWLLARELLGHSAPFFAPVAAIVSLGTSYGQRLRRVAEVTAGVALGVGIGDLFVRWVVPRSSVLSVEVILAQVRSVVVDLLQAAGLDADDAWPPSRRCPESSCSDSACGRAA